MSDPHNSIYIGIDLGTSGCRAVAIEHNGSVIASGSEDLPESTGDELCREQQPQDWWKAVCNVLSAVLASIDAQRVTAIAVDGTSGTLFLADNQGQPLGPALMYNDARSQSEAEQIARYAPEASAAHGPTSGLAKLLYLLKQPFANKAGYTLHQADWITARLCGRYGVSDENNCLKLGYDVIQRRWPEWMQSLGIHCELLPRVFAPGTVLGDIEKPLADRFGLAGHTRIIAGTTDGVAAFLATGASSIADAVTSLGSTLVLKVLSEQPLFSPQHGIYSHRLGDRWLAGGASNCGGKVLLQYFNQHQLDMMTPQLCPDKPTGLDYYPLPSLGERFPYNDPDMLPNLSPRPENDVLFFQGMLEGITHVEADGYHLLADLGAPFPSCIRTVGKGAKNQAWTSIREARLHVPLYEATHDQPAYGTAILARNAGQAARITP